VLNGFSEFIRNLLICKDDRIAGLLEVVDSFKEKYISTAKKTDTGFLISALNILNETEISYKSARNKRLHVELALIRLTYLLQAIELSTSPDGIIKKKLVDDAKPVAFKNIPVFRLVSKSPEKKEQPKLIIEKPVEEQKVKTPELEKEEPAQEKETEKNITSVKSAQLDKLRKQIASRSNAAETKSIPLTLDKLQESWNDYTNMLRENKNPALQSFVLAQLIILNDSSFEVITNNNLEQKFIEQEKRLLSEHLQKAFANKAINFTVKITDNPVDFTPSEKTLSKKDQFLLLAEQYPMIKELKDRLKLDLDY